MKRVPISFTHKGKEYSGLLSQVQGAGTTAVYHLTVDGYYKGRLRKSAFDDSWIFDGEYADLAEAFGAWILTVQFVKEEVSSAELLYLVE